MGSRAAEPRRAHVGGGAGRSPARRQPPAPDRDVPLSARVIALQRATGNRAVTSLVRSVPTARRLQRETYETKLVGSDQDALWTQVVGAVTSWAAYAKAASEHLEANRNTQPEYAKLRERLDAHVRLAGIFADKVKDGPRYAGQFVVVLRDGQVGALAIRRLIGTKHAFLDDLWSNPKKAYQISPADRIPGRDVSGAVAVEYLVAETHGRGGDLKLIGGDRSAREYYWKLGFGVRAKTAESRLPQLTFSPHEAVDVNPTEGTTERAMELPRDRQTTALTSLRAAIAPPAQVPAPAAAAPVAVQRPARDWGREWPTSSWDAYVDWMNG